MKLENVKVGQRVQYKLSRVRPERSGALGTIRESDSRIPFVEWDDDEHNSTTYAGVRVASAHIDNLRKVK